MSLGHGTCEGVGLGPGGWNVEALNGECDEIQCIWRSVGCKGIFRES